MIFQDLETLPASAGPMKYAFLQKSAFSIPRVFLESFWTSFESFWPLQIGLNRVLEALLNRSECPSICEVKCFHCLVSLANPRGMLQWDPAIPSPFPFRAIFGHCEPLKGYDAQLEMSSLDACNVVRS